MSSSATTVATSAAALLLGAPSAAQSPAPPEPTAIVDVRLADAADAPRVSLLLRDGRVAEILAAGAPIPPGVRRVEGAGLLALPAFIDAYTTAGCEAPEPVAERDAPPPADADVLTDMRSANRKGLAPAWRAADAFLLDESAMDKRRAQGFGALHTCPEGQILAGRSALVSLADGPPRERVILANVFQVAGLRAGGRGYPSTLMGLLAHLRQFLLDARWQALLVARYGAGEPDPRPPYDPDLEAILPALSGQERLLCAADDARDIRRWLKLADEFGFSIAIAGGREAWKVAGELATRGVPVILTLDWGEEVADPDAATPKENEQEQSQAEDAPPVEPVEEPAVGGGEPAPAAAGEPRPEQQPEAEPEAEQAWEYEEPLGVRRERRRLWLEKRDNAIRLHQAGVTLAFGTGSRPAEELLAHLRDLIEAGLPEEAARAGLTGGAAAVLGAGSNLGRIEKGRDATLALWSQPPFTKKATLRWLFVDGAGHEFEAQEEGLAGVPDEGLDLDGAWSLDFESEEASDARMTLEMKEGGAVAGVFETTSPIDGSPVKGDLGGQVSGRALRLKGTLSFGAFEAELHIEGEIEGNSIKGEATWKYSGGEQASSYTARRAPGRSGAARRAEGAEGGTR